MKAIRNITRTLRGLSCFLKEARQGLDTEVSLFNMPFGKLKGHRVWVCHYNGSFCIMDEL